MAVPQARIEQFHIVENPGQTDRKADASLESRLLRTVDEYYALTKLSRPRRYYLQTLAACFVKGIHYVDFSPYRGTLEEWPQKKVDKCLLTPSGLLQFTVEVIASQYTTSNARTVPMTEGEADPKTKAILRALTDYADYLDWDFYRRDPAQRQTEAKMIPQRGVYNFVEWDKSAGAKLELPQYQPQSGEVCGDCGAEIGEQDANMGMGVSGNRVGPDRGNNSVTPSLVGGTGSDRPGTEPVACPECNSANVQQVTTGVQNQGNVKARQGAPKRNVIDSFQVEIYDRGRGISESEYLIYDDAPFITKIKKEYPWVKAVKGSASLGNYTDGFLGLHYLNQLQTLLANTGQLDQKESNTQRPTTYAQAYNGSFLNPLLCWRRRVWLDREVYEGWTTNEFEATQLPGVAQAIPPNTKLVDLFPDGLCLHILNGVSIIKMENQDKNKAWTFCSYRVPSEGLHGTGVSSLISLIRGHDLLTSFELQGVLMAALGIIVVDNRIGQIENVPGRVVRIDESARLPNEPISSLAARLDMGGAAAVTVAEPVKQGFRAHIADMSMASSPNASGLDREGMKTAHGVEYQKGVVNTLTNPPLELYSAHRALVIQQAVELERTHGIRPRAFGKFGESVKKWIDPLSLPEDLQFAAAEDSWQTRTFETEKNDLGSAINIGVGQGKLNPIVEEQAMRVFGLDEDIDDYEDWAVKGEKRLDAIDAALPAIMQEMQQPEAQQAAQVMNPQTGQPAYNPVQRLIEVAQARPQPMDGPGHQHFMRFYETVYNTDAWDTFAPLKQQAIAMLWQAHQSAGMQLQQQMAAAQNAPEQQAQDKQNEHEQSAADAEHGRNAEASQREQEGAQADHGRQITQAIIQHKAAELSAEQAHRNALELEAKKQQGEKQKQKFALQLEAARRKGRNTKR